MKKGFLAILTALVLVLCLVQAPALAASVPSTQWEDYAADAFAGGTGTEADPYLIETGAQLAKLAKDVKNGQSYEGNYFRLEKDIDLSAHRWNPIGVYAWQPSGATTTRPFRGFLDGNHKTISGLTVSEKNKENAAGLFGNIRKGNNNGKTGVKDLTIQNAYIEANNNGLMENSAGILAGYVLANDGYTIEFSGITVSGVMRMESDNGNMIAGGMLGNVSRATVTDCHAVDMDIEACSNSGGLVGMDCGSKFSDCSAEGKLSGGWTLGGFVGYALCSDLNNPSTSASSYSHCYADVDVTGYDWRLGGFAGLMEHGSIENSVAMGDVESTVTNWAIRVGGLVGEAFDTTVQNSHSASQLKIAAGKEDEAGGVVGHVIGGTLSNVSYDSEKNPEVADLGVVEQAPSGQGDGEKSQKVLSNICQDYYGGHLWGNTTIVDKEPTCAEEGVQSKHCTRCDEHGMEEILPKTENHQFVWVIDRQPSAGAAGSKHEECKICGLKKDPVEIPALPNTGDNSTPALWAALLILSGCILASNVVLRKKKSQNQ